MSERTWDRLFFGGMAAWLVVAMLLPQPWTSWAAMMSLVSGVGVIVAKGASR